jgi:hypothetical protein
MKRLVIGSAALLAALCISNPAEAACEKQVAQAERTQGVAVAEAYKAIVACDAKVAKQSFPKVMQNAGDSEALIALSMVAIDAEIWNPVWEMLGKIPDYDARDVVADGIGKQCAEDDTVVKFLQGAYFGLRDIDFQQWDDALVSCQSESFDGWVVQTVENPPAKVFDEKYAKVAEVYVARNGAAALPALANGAQAAAKNGGPFDAILALMDQAVAPELGEDMDPAEQKQLEDALVGMASVLPPEQARSVADRLANAGSDKAAAALLPAIYPDRFKDGSFTYGAVAVEAGDCDGVQTAVLHVVEVTENATRYILSDDLTAPMRAAKPKLKKCTSEGDWTVIATDEPLGGDLTLDAFVSGLEASYADKGYEVSLKSEKGITLD